MEIFEHMERARGARWRRALEELVPENMEVDDITGDGGIIVVYQKKVEKIRSEIYGKKKAVEDTIRKYTSNKRIGMHIKKKGDNYFIVNLPNSQAESMHIMDIVLKKDNLGGRLNREVGPMESKLMVNSMRPDLPYHIVSQNGYLVVSTRIGGKRKYSA